MHTLKTNALRSLDSGLLFPQLSDWQMSLDWLEHLQVSPMAGGWNLAFIGAKDPTSGSKKNQVLEPSSPEPYFVQMARNRHS